MMKVTEKNMEMGFWRSNLTEWMCDIFPQIKPVSQLGKNVKMDNNYININL